VLKKRLIGVVTVKDGWAVQSIGYRRYLPLGHPEILVENLDRWGADEILLQVIDRSQADLGPDLDLLARVSAMGLATPLIYAGGIATVAQGVAVVKAGADRVCIDAALHENPGLGAQLAQPLGAQAIIAALPVSLGADGSLAWRDHRSGVDKPLSPELLNLLDTGAISEALLIDWQGEGAPGAFDERILAAFPAGAAPLIAFGGLSQADQLKSVLTHPRVAAAAIGNFLSYREHAVQHYRQQLPGIPLRPAAFASSFGLDQ
jgi:cyclase